MPSKYEIISALASQEAVNITSGVAQYEAFLVTAANNYKYTFREQLLIHAQKPEATACAEITLWNKLGRWVNGGTKGIALLVEGNKGYKLRHVFDYSDTNSRVGRTITLWRLQPQYEDGVIEAMTNSFGATIPEGDFVQTLMQFTDTLVEDNFTDYRDMLMEVKSGSLLEELDELNTEVWLKSLVKSSVAFMALTRCGYDARQYLDAEDFQHLRDFNTQEVISVLGGASSDIAEMALREIEATVRALSKAEKNQVRTFAQSPSMDDNGIDNSERSDRHEPDLSQRGGLSAPQPDRPGEPEDREIWNAAAKLPEGAQGPDLHRDAAVREVEPASGGDRPDGQRDDGAPDHGDGEVGGRDGEPESDGPDEVGRPDEQHPTEGRGDRDGGADLRLTQESSEDGPDEAPTSELDFSDYYPEYPRSQIDYFYQDDEKRELIRTSPALKDHRVEIAAFFASHQEVKERCDFIKSFYSNEVYETTLSNGQAAGYRAYDDLLRLFRGSSDNPEREDNLRWSYIASVIEGMMVMHEWLAPDEAPLPSEGEQIALIQEEQAEKETRFEVPQEAIDYVLTGGSGVRNSNLSIYEQFQKEDDPQENVAFLKKLYGTGGRSSVIPGSGIWEDHDSKGIILKRGDKGDSDYLRVKLTWAKVEKRIRELIAADRFLNSVEKKAYSELTDLNRNLMLSIDVIPVPTDEAVREVESRLLGVETNITNWQRRQNQNNNFSAIVPYDMELQRKEAKEFLNDLTTRDQRMMFAVVTLVHMADSKKQLDQDTESLLSLARKNMCQMATLKFQQIDGLNTALPFGYRKINAFRTLTTEKYIFFTADHLAVARVSDLFLKLIWNGSLIGRKLTTTIILSFQRKRS